MKHIMEFNLPEDRADLELHQKAPEYYGVLHDMADEIRRYNKYDDRSVLPESITGDALHKWFWDHMNERGVDL